MTHADEASATPSGEPKPGLCLRPAVPGDAPLLRHWDEQPHVVASDPNDDWQWESELGRAVGWREQLVAELDGRPIGYVEIIDPAREEQHYWGNVGPNLRAIDIWIGPAADLGQGYGTRMMQLALARCFADRAVEAVLVDPLAANVRAQRFYQRLGFRFVERRQFGDDDCAVHELKREWHEAVERRRRDSGEAGRIAMSSQGESRDMFDHVGFGVSDLEASKAFFVRALAPLGAEVVMEGPYGVGIGSKRKPSLWLHAAGETPVRMHVAFAAPSRRAVDAFYAAAIAAGGRDNGAPGLRPHYHANYYAAFVLSPDGHNVEAVCHQPES